MDTVSFSPGESAWRGGRVAAEAGLAGRWTSCPGDGGVCGNGADVPALSLSVHEFLATCQDYPYVMADSLLDVLTKGGHSRALQELETVRMLLKKQGHLPSALKR